ncbi:aspartate ammonia-lyase [bacterium SCSIO 12696]|nr:aspartate ammonia-lyase [bacterium SCSIO 12696]
MNALSSETSLQDSQSLDYHTKYPAGKIQTSLPKALNSMADLAIAYSPGVAAPVRAIAADQRNVNRYTARGNTVAVVSNGSAILGLGNLGPYAAKPVMEGKAALFKRFADINAVDLELDVDNPDHIISVVKALEPSFGGINLEDISAPDCFYIEEKLQAAMDIPVFHDDQHGTAIVVCAALLKACEKQQKCLHECKVVINGAGAAALATANMLLALGVSAHQLTLCDIVGVLHSERRQDVHEWHRPFLRETDARTLAEVAPGADILIGLSARDAFNQDLMAMLAERPIVFALANPEPEILPPDVLAVRPDAVIATGRSDYPNQVNNLLAFPFVFRGALDVGATAITEAMKVAAVKALARINCPKGDILPTIFNPMLAEAIPAAVAKAAVEDGVAQIMEKQAPEILADPGYEFMQPMPEAEGAVRLECDPLGEVPVPAASYFGPQTVRALRNFPISGNKIADMPELLLALAWVKKSSALTNKRLKLVDAAVANAIIAACDEIIAGRHHHDFCVDVIQGGAGTSTNMNCNEVIANRAQEIMGYERGRYDIVHPNDHVNCNQSTNDSYATAVRIAVHQLSARLEQGLNQLALAIEEKAVEFAHIPKLARTQLQDAVPMTLGQEFRAFAETLFEDVSRASEIKSLFLEVNLGGTAIGTGVGANLDYQSRVVAVLCEVSGLPFRASKNRIEATWDMGAFTLFSGMLKRLAMKLSKISNDLRLLSSGPAGGIGEIKLPDRQPGSSIMPGKVNPVIPEVVNQVCFRVFGMDTAITFAAEAGQLQLNAMEPLILYSIHESCSLLLNAMATLKDNCIAGIEANEARCLKNLQNSTALAVNLVSVIGYERAASIAKQAQATEQAFVEYLKDNHPELLGFVDNANPASGG